MITTVELLDEVKKTQGIETKYALAKLLDCGQSSVANWYKKDTMNDRYALRCADLADLDPGYVLYSMAAERALKKKDERLFQFWKKQADKIGPALLAVSACFLTIIPAIPLPF
ncbi:helix-turn-helix domain-containing protein [Endozoicomonas arenosclerae]|uniref:helix-turn-helix domain-containing protein n=1 Tax=Endozoicomonas arenosclerae TaxID=1633495 RepID=UPI0007827FEF|nr:helix-turn-helix domain-containing protein [Endozoicomonas arenosclerae]